MGDQVHPQQAKQGPEWAFFRWLRLSNPDGSKYLTRLRIIQTPWFGLYLHWIYAPDGGRDLHDHPWWFVSFLIKGRYTEECGSPWGDRWAFGIPDRAVIETANDGFKTYPTLWRWKNDIKWINRKSATGLHQILSMTRSPVISLVLVGPRVRKWGFVTPKGEWIQAEHYFASGKGTIKQ